MALESNSTRENKEVLPDAMKAHDGSNATMPTVSAVMSKPWCRNHARSSPPRPKAQMMATAT